MIRQATLKDAADIARVHVASWQTTYTGIMPDEAIAARPVAVRLKQWRHSLINQHSETIYLVAEEDGQIIGFASGGKPQADNSGFDSELYAIYLLERAQRKGIGRRLMQAVAQQFIAAGYKTMVLSVLKGNAQSSKFYAAMGGKPVSEGTYRVTNKITLTTVNYGWHNLQTLVES